MRSHRLGCVFLSFAFLLQGCTEPGETTAVGAATGGVIGAGLGAIIGNQTGDPGSGLAVGALAGAGTGAAIANSLEAQDKRMREQDEVLTRQEKTIQAQRSEITQLRTLAGSESADAPQPGSGSSAATAGARGRMNPSQAAMGAGNAESEKQQIVSRDLATSRTRSAASQAGESRAEYSGAQDSGAHVALNAQQPRTVECQVGEQEYQKSKRLTDNADKLFHLRRALRMCPGQADYHNALGEVYVSLNRVSDAEFEFREALKANPQHEEAKLNLRSVSGAAR